MDSTGRLTVRTASGATAATCASLGPANIRFQVLLPLIQNG